MASIGTKSEDEDVPLNKKFVPKDESQGADEKQNTIVENRVQKTEGGGDAGGKKATQSDGVQKRVRKVFDKPGQTRETPPEEDPQRRFYTSLLEQKPKSEMAQKWCVMNGLLPVEEAKKWVAKHGKKPAVKNIKTNGGTAKGKSPAKRKKEGKGEAKKKAQKYKEEEPGDSDEQEVIPKKKKRASLPEGAAKPIGRDAVRFDDDSDEDVPLAQKIRG